MLLHLREEYLTEGLDIKHLDNDPILQFDRWFRDAVQVGVREVNAMTLATATKDALPSARIVLLKDYSPEGFTFFTNYESRKGQDLAENPHGALVFFWAELHRQVRIEGTVEKVAANISEAYFQSRPLGSQLGAWASPQSSVLENREMLESKLADVMTNYAGQEKLPLPAFWGGYIVRPTAIEFWQGRPSRLHDRFRYMLQNDESWKIERLAP